MFKQYLKWLLGTNNSTLLIFLQHEIRWVICNVALSSTENFSGLSFTFINTCTVVVQYHSSVSQFLKIVFSNSHYEFPSSNGKLYKLVNIRIITKWWDMLLFGYFCS